MNVNRYSLRKSVMTKDGRQGIVDVIGTKGSHLFLVGVTWQDQTTSWFGDEGEGYTIEGAISDLILKELTT